MPISLSASSTSIVDCGSAMNAVSVNSNSRYWGSNPVSSKMARTCATKFVERNSTAEIFTATGTRARLPSFQCRLCRQASRSTQRPMGTM